MKKYIEPELNLHYGVGPCLALTASGDAHNSPWDESWDSILPGGGN